MKANDLDIYLRILMCMQLILELMDDLSHSPHYKREVKMRTENYYTFVARHVEFTTELLTPEQSDQWAMITKKMRDIINEIQIQEG